MATNNKSKQVNKKKPRAVTKKASRAVAKKPTRTVERKPPRKVKRKVKQNKSPKREDKNILFNPDIDIRVAKKPTKNTKKKSA